MKRFLIIGSVALFVVACGGSGENESKTSESTEAGKPTENANPTYDANRGEGKFDNIKLAATLDGGMADKGEKIVDLKCLSCHKTTDEKLVGPGWKGVTTRHKPEWIMNFITNPDPMIDKDPKVQAMLELCLVRMPNQSLSDEDARNILEFMRKNDGVK